jgi:hypothetical protein
MALPREASRASRAMSAGSSVIAAMIPFGRVTPLLLTVALALAIAVPMHWWPTLPAGYRRRLSIATSLAGLGFLVAALRTEGLRESALTSLVLVGPATLTARASASASLYYYVLTGFCLGLGFSGLIFSDPLARWLKPRPLLTSVSVAWLVTVFRILLEKSAAPAVLVEAAGVTWLAPIAGVYLALALRPEAGATALLPVLVRYAFLVRGFVALVGIVATRLAAGTHYDVSPLTEVGVAFSDQIWTFVASSWLQIFWLTLLPQLVIWPAFTVLAGLATGAAVLLLLSRTLDEEPAAAAAPDAVVETAPEPQATRAPADAQSD